MPYFHLLFLISIYYSLFPAGWRGLLRAPPWGRGIKHQPTLEMGDQRGHVKEGDGPQAPAEPCRGSSRPVPALSKEGATYPLPPPLNPKSLAAQAALQAADVLGYTDGASQLPIMSRRRSEPLRGLGV